MPSVSKTFKTIKTVSFELLGKDVPGARLIKRTERPPEATHGHAATGWVANGQEELKPKIVSPYHHLLSIFIGWKKDKYSKIRGEFFLKSTSLKDSPLFSSKQNYFELR